MDAPAAAGRTPPSALDAESAVLSAILLEASALDEVPFLEPKHFYADANRRIYQATLELRAEGRPVDIVTVAGYLRDRECLQQIGGSPYLAQLSDATPAVAHIADHAKTIVTKWEVRQIIFTAQRIAAEGYGDIGDPEEWKQSVDQMVYAATRTLSREENIVILSDATRDAIQTVQDRMNHKGLLMSGVTTGLPTLDARLGGLEAGRVYVVAARPGQGKAQPLSAKVLTPTGWVTMGDLRVGDLVIGGDGKPTQVKRIFERGELPVFRVTMADGGSTLCCDDHLWLTRNRAERRAKHPPSVKPLSEIRAKLTRCASGGLMHSVRYMGPAEYAPTGALPLHPYLVGVYLGDGCHNGVISNPEPDVQTRFGSLLPDTDTFKIADQGKTLRVSRAKKSNAVSTYVAALRSMGLGNLVAETKFIPAQYLRASVEDRLELLRGLCDTDGFVATDKNIEYVTVSKRLADGIQELVKGLGGHISCNEKLPTYRYKGKKLQGQLAYRMVFGFSAGGITPVTSRKHLAKWDSSPIRVPERFIKSVEPEGTQVCRCIEVASDLHLYVTDDYIVTHNTALATGMVLACAYPPEPNNPDSMGDGVVFISVEMPRKQIAMRVLSQVARVDSNKLIRGQNKITPDEWKRIMAAQLKLQRMPIAIEDSSNHTPASIRAAMRMGRRRLEERFGKQVKVRVGAIDYLQLLSGTGGDNREQEIAGISRACKSIAKDEGLAMIPLAQVNRECEKRKPPIPIIPDLRESGAIEQDADVIIFIYREDYYRPKGDTMDNKAQLIVAKWRDGQTGIVRCEFEPTTTTFFENSSNPDYEQLGDIFDDYIPGTSGEPFANKPHWTDDEP